MYQVLARKWRPKTLDELIGQAHVARTLRNAIEAGRVAHAYLFAGVRGTGKTTVARILAKCLNCESGPAAIPCGECSACREIADGRSLDVLELDAASRTGVDDIRELQEFVAYPPVRDRHKVLIIDEVHMLSKNAFNALLKTLEEPPARVVFILATTELQKILQTILSRCQLFEFRRVEAREVAAHLRMICSAEKIAISDRTVDRVARAGDGSVRDSLSVLERVLAFCGTDVDEDEALEVLGSVRTDVLTALVGGMARRDGAAMIEALDRVVQDGHDLVHFWSELIGVLRDLMLLRAAPDRRDLLSRAPEDVDPLEEAAASLTDEDLLRIFHLLADLEFGLRSAAQPRFLFEAFLLRVAALGKLRPIEEVAASLACGERSVPGGPAPSNRPSSPRGSASGGAPARTPPAPTRGDQKKNRASAEDAPARAEALINALHDERPMIATMIEKNATIAFEADTLTLTFPAGADAVRRMVEAEEHLAVVRRCAEAVAGRPLHVRVAVPERREKPGTTAHDATKPEENAPPSTPNRGERGSGTLAERVREDPTVRRLLTEFGAQIVDVRPLEAPAVDVDHAGTMSAQGEEPS